MEQAFGYRRPYSRLSAHALHPARLRQPYCFCRTNPLLGSYAVAMHMLYGCTVLACEQRCYACLSPDTAYAAMVYSDSAATLHLCQN